MIESFGWFELVFFFVWNGMHSRNDWIGIFIYVDLFLIKFSFKNLFVE